MPDSHRFIPRGGDDYGTPQVDLARDFKLPERKIDQVHVCVVEHENGGEAVYGQVIDGVGMTNFVTENIERRKQLNALLVQQGTYEVCQRLGKRIFWRVYDARS